jgi:hypothetical protein
MRNVAEVKAAIELIVKKIAEAFPERDVKMLPFGTSKDYYILCTWRHKSDKFVDIFCREYVSLEELLMIEQPSAIAARFVYHCNEWERDYYEKEKANGNT